VHIDRNCVTIHWWSSRPGLYVFGPDGRKYSTNETAQDRIAMFPGKKFVGLTDCKYGLGTPHGVVDRMRAESLEDRFAIVTFVHSALTKEQARRTKALKLTFDLLEEKSVL
jgi:hypothetical protein